MKTDIDVEGILKDILTVLNKHSVPANTISLDISLLGEEFDNLIFQNELISRYKSRVLHKSLQIEGNVPAAITIKRRMPYDEIIATLESEVLPIMQEWSKELGRDFENLQIKANVVRSDNRPRSFHKHFYEIDIHCSKKGSTKKSDYGDLVFSIDLSQYDATSYPVINASVGMLVDEEGEGDWGLDRVANFYPGEGQEVDEGTLERLKESLPHLYQSLRTALEKTGNNQDSVQ